MDLVSYFLTAAKWTGCVCLGLVLVSWVAYLVLAAVAYPSDTEGER